MALDQIYDVKHDLFNITVEERADIRKNVTEFVLKAGLNISKEMLEEILGEVLQNVNKHAYLNEGGPVFIEVTRKDNVFIVTFRDYGKGFNPPSLNEDCDFFHNSTGHGMGLNLISKMLNKDNFIIDSHENIGTTFILRFDPETTPIMKS